MRFYHLLRLGLMALSSAIFSSPTIAQTISTEPVSAQTVSAHTVSEQAAPNSSHSPALSFSTALQLAEQQAPSLVAQTASVNAARSAAIPAAALPDPQLVIGTDNVPISGADRGSLNSDFMTMERIGVMQDIPNGDKRRARADVAAAAIAKAEAERNIERLKVRRETAIAWLNRFYLERQLDVLGELDQENHLLDSAAKARLSSGKGMASEVLMPQLEAVELADRRDEIQQEITQAIAMLRRWVGDEAARPLAGDAPVLSFDPNHLSEQLHRHPELAAYGPMTDMAAAEVREAEAEKKSDWGVEFDYQRRAAPYSDMVSLQFKFDLPVFSGTRQTPRIEAKRHELERIDADRRNLLREHAAELDTDLAQYTRLRQQLSRLQTTRLPLATQKVELQMASYRSGQSDLSALIAARRELIETRLRQIELQSQYAALAAKLTFSYGDNVIAENTK